MKRYLFLILLPGLLFLHWLPVEAAETRAPMGHGMSASAAPIQEYAPMPAPGKKVPIGEGYYLVYSFDKQLKMGTVIMMVELFTADGKKETALEVKADTDMPSMRGAHATGDRAFKQNKKGDYLLPIPIVMPGDWEIRLSVVKDGKVIFRGRHNFNV